MADMSPEEIATFLSKLSPEEQSSCAAFSRCVVEFTTVSPASCTDQQVVQISKLYSLFTRFCRSLQSRLLPIASLCWSPSVHLHHHLHLHPSPSQAGHL